MGRIIRQGFAQSLGLIQELAAGERGKIPHLRKDDGVEIYLQALPTAGWDSGRRGMNKLTASSAWKDLGAGADVAKFVFTQANTGSGN